MIRQKSKLEGLLSFMRHRKKWGAGKHAKPIANFEAMKTQVVEDTGRQPTSGKKRSIDEHMANLRLEFAGQSELVFHHAKLIVLLRREYKIEQTYADFCALWELEGEYLRQHVNMRWLISAADTFAAHDRDMTVRAIAMMVSLFVTTIRVYETDRFANGAQNLPILPEKIAELQPFPIPLFDGLVLIKVGSDDTLRNMRWRLEQFFKHGSVGKIAETIYYRMIENETAFARFKALHTKERTIWW